MATVSLTTLISTLRSRTDKQEDNKWSDAVLTSALNDGITELYDLLVVLDPDPITTTYDWTTDGTATFALPSTTYSIRAVDLVHSTTSVSTVLPQSLQERNKYKGTIYVNQLAPGPFYYDRQADNLVIYPTPQSGKTLTMYYIPEPTLLSDGSDTFEFRNGWQEYVINTAAIKLSVPEEEEFSGYEFLRQRAEQRIRKVSRYLGTSPFSVANLSYRRRRSETV